MVSLVSNPTWEYDNLILMSGSSLKNIFTRTFCLCLLHPQDILKEIICDFELLLISAPVITEETTKTLEEIIIQRIKDKVRC